MAGQVDNSLFNSLRRQGCCSQLTTIKTELITETQGFHSATAVACDTVAYIRGGFVQISFRGGRPCAHHSDNESHPIGPRESAPGRCNSPLAPVGGLSHGVTRRQ